MQKRGGFRVSVGISSLLMIFIVLALTTFSVLGYVTANSDYKLAEKTANGVTSYYQADATAERFLASVDRKLSAMMASAQQLETSNNLEGLPCGLLPGETADKIRSLQGETGSILRLASYQALAQSLAQFDLGFSEGTLVQEGWTVTAEIPVDDVRKLVLEIQLEPNPFDESVRYTVLKRRLVSTVTYNEDDSNLELWQGELV